MMGVRCVIYIDLRRRSDVAQSRVSRHWLKVNSVTSSSGPVLPHSLLGNFNHILGTSDRLPILGFDPSSNRLLSLAPEPVHRCVPHRPF